MYDKQTMVYVVCIMLMYCWYLYDTHKSKHIKLMDNMALRKVLKAIKTSLIVEQARIPKTMLGNFIHKFKIHSMESRIADIETELLKRKTKKL